LGGSGGLTEYARLDKAVSYTNKIGEYNFGANYSFGNVSGNNSAGSVYNFGAGYDNGTLGIQAVYTSMTDAVAGGAANSDTAPGIKVTVENIRSYLLAMKYKLTNTVTLKAGYQTFMYTAPSDHIAVASYFGYTPVATTYLGATGTNPYNSASDTAGNQHFLHVGVDYQYSDNLYLGAAYYNRTYDATAGAPADNSKNISFVSLLADYNLSKRTDVYAGFMSVQAGGNGWVVASYSSTGSGPNNRYGSPSGVNNNSIIGFGMRHKF
jgi:hypothetical protein